MGYMEDALDEIVGTSDCPFATETLAEGRVRIVKGNAITILKEVDDWNDQYEVIVIIPKSWSGGNYYDWCLSMETELAKRDLIAIPNSKQGYILLQRLSDLVDASNSLLKSGFYDDYTREQISHVIRRRGLSEQWPRL